MLDQQGGRPSWHGEAPRRRGGGWFVAAGLVVLSLALAMARRPLPEAPAVPAPDAPADLPPESAPPVLSAFAHVAWPTPQTNLVDAPIAAVIQPTASGRPESGLYGSVRTANYGRQVAASFHEGLDIAPTGRDRRGRALDAIYAVAAGRVAYVSPHAGNSNYGKYVVLVHADPVGEVYTLYAHLAEIAPGVAAGKTCAPGALLGRMGNTPSGDIPVSRSHLHFEVGLIAHDRFAAWMQAQRTKNPHGRYNGWNFFGVDPLACLRAQREQGAAFTLLDHLATIPVAYELVLPAGRLPDYFRRYPRLWQGGPFNGPALVVACSEGGVPLRGRAATAEEAVRTAGRRGAVLSADPAVLGRNGKHFVSARGGEWAIGAQGRQWVELFLY